MDEVLQNAIKKPDPAPKIDFPPYADDEKLLDRKQAATFLTVEMGLKTSAATLAKWYSTRSDGPPVEHWGRYPKYRKGRLRRWATERLTAPRTSSSQEAA